MADKPKPATGRLDNRRRFVVVARGGDPEKVTREEYEKDYSGYEDEVLARYPEQDLAKMRNETKNPNIDPSAASGFLPKKAEEATDAGTSKSVSVETHSGVASEVGSGSKSPVRS